VAKGSGKVTALVIRAHRTREEDPFRRASSPIRLAGDDYEHRRSRGTRQGVLPTGALTEAGAPGELTAVEHITIRTRRGGLARRALVNGG